MKNVELARVLDKRAERKRKAGEDGSAPEPMKKQKAERPAQEKPRKAKRQPESNVDDKQLSSVLGSIF